MRLPETLPCIALAGPTASGKTAGALALAASLAPHCPVEIVSVDSALVYRGMDIGTAKPTPDELAAVPHHLIDIRDPLHAYSAAEFVADATRLIAQIRARGALPLLVGGTMLYFKALLDGIDDMPPADPAVRAELEARAAAIGWPGMHAEPGPRGPGHRRAPGTGGQPAHPARAGGVAHRRAAAVELSHHQKGSRGRRQYCGGCPFHSGARRPRLAAWPHRPALRRHAGRRFRR